MELGQLPCLVDCGTSEPLEVEMEERWAENEELMMDVDMTTELQQEVYQQVCSYGVLLLLLWYHVYNPQYHSNNLFICSNKLTTYSSVVIS